MMRTITQRALSRAALALFALHLSCGAELGGTLDAGTLPQNCAAGEVRCAGICIDPKTDPAHCGASGTCEGANAGSICGATETCSAGMCRADEAVLAALGLSEGTLVPAFSPLTTMYAVADVPFWVSALSVTPTTQAPGATILVEGITVGSGLTSGPVLLTPGMPMIRIVVTAQGGAQRTYTLVVSRAANPADYVKATNAGAGDEFGSSLAMSGDTLVIGAPAEDSSSVGVGGDQNSNALLESGAVYVLLWNGVTWTPEAYLKAHVPGNGDRFGGVVAISGNTIAVAARQEDSSSTGIDASANNNSAGDSGAVYIFTRNGTTWSQQAYIKATNTNGGDQFGSSLALYGDTLAVGAINEDSNATGTASNGGGNNSASEAGAVYVYVRTGNAWTWQAYIKASNTNSNDRFGTSVSLFADTLAVGAPGEDSNAAGIAGDQGNNSLSDAGAVYVFSRTGSAWTQQSYIKASNPGASDNFGAALSLSSDILAVGAPNENSASGGINGTQSDESQDNAGAVYVFSRAGGAWTQEAYMKAQMPSANATFGSSLSLDGERLVVGASTESSSSVGIGGTQTSPVAGFEQSGAAYVFTRVLGAWAQRAYLKASNTAAQDRFGIAVATAGSRVLVGASLEDSSAVGIGGDATNNAAMQAGAVFGFR